MLFLWLPISGLWRQPFLARGTPCAPWMPKCTDVHVLSCPSFVGLHGKSKDKRRKLVASPNCRSRHTCMLVNCHCNGKLLTSSTVSLRASTASSASHFDRRFAERAASTAKRRPRLRSARTSRCQDTPPSRICASPTRHERNGDIHGPKKSARKWGFSRHDSKAPTMKTPKLPI